MQRQEQDDRSEGSSRSYRRYNTSSDPNTRLKFIIIPNPEAIRDRSKVRTARAHAVTVARARSRLKAQEDGSNFRLKTFDVDRSNLNDGRGQDPSMLAPPTPPRPVGPSSIDPFETLPVNARRLTKLFYLKSSLRAGEPVFNVNDAVHYQSLQAIFESGLSDGALTAALSLTLAYAASGWRMNDECIEFSSIAMEQVRQKLSDPVTAVSSATIGTVLLLLGNAYRLGELDSAKAHLHGLRMLLRLCSQRNIKTPPALKRAIYWQDLFSSIFLGTDRIVGYANFYPDHQLTIEHMGRDSCLPSGFLKSAHFLGSDFLKIAEDVAILYANRQKLFAFGDPPEGMERLDNIQAQLEGRIHTLRQATSDHMLLCCIVATHLCVYGFWDGVWNAALIPRELSIKVLYHLRCCQLDNLEDDDLFFWLVYVGKAFAIDAWVRNELDNLWFKQHSNAEESTFPPWHDAKCILSKFIWSEVLYSEENGWFWERIGEYASTREKKARSLDR